ncbi:hypothetical protein NCC49_004170 [Naganishia albida]|nr:hypothetical protein NCC49_004170 [Naganishia albida]
MAAPAIDLKKQAAPAEEPKVEEKGLSNDALTKYTTAGTILGEVLKKFIPTIQAGKSVLDLCTEGDKLVSEAVAGVWNNKKGLSKGLAFPTSVSVNNTVSHFSPLPSDKDVPVLKDGDVVKVMLGVHIDGYASIHAETVVVGADASSPVDGKKADVVKAAYDAAQLAMRLIKPTVKNFDITQAIQDITADFGCKPVENMLSCQHEQNVTDGKKRIIINPDPESRRSHENCVFEEGEVYGVDVLVVTGEDGKARPEESRTTIYKRSNDVTYQLKMKTSRTVFTEIQKKAGSFPFTLRTLDDEKRARMGVQEAVQHGLLRPYDVVYTKEGTQVAEFFFTLALLPAGPLLLSPAPVWYSADKVKSDASTKNEEYKTLLGKKLREDKKKKKKAAAAAEPAASS